MKLTVFLLAFAMPMVVGAQGSGGERQPANQASNLSKAEFRRQWELHRPPPVPITISLEELYASPGWTDWIGISYGVSFVDKRGAKALVMLELNRNFGNEKVRVATPDEKGAYSIERTIETTPTRAFRLAHWRELQQYESEQREATGEQNRGTIRSVLEDWHVAVGFLTDKLRTNENENDSGEVQGYFAGMIRTVSPYANFHIGFALFDDGKVRGVPSAGFTLDLAVLGKIFK